MFDNLNDTFKNIYKLAKKRRISHEKNETFDESKLQEYMLSLDYETIKIIETIMYLGRDAEYNKRDNYEKRYRNARMFSDKCESNFCEINLNEIKKNKEAKISQILGKMPLDKYLLDGFKILGIVNIK